MDYNLNPDAAKAADNINARIETSGKYFGEITRAEQVTAKSGAKGVDFSFKAETGETADYLSLWTHGGDGKELHGFKVLMAIMTCLRVRGIKSEVGEVEKYDSQTKQRQKFNVPLYKELMNKPVGFLIQQEEYEKTSGGTAWSSKIFSAFDKDGFTASEILNKATKPEKMEKMLLALKDRPLKVGAATAKANTQGSAAPSNAFDDDDVWF